MNWKTPSCAGLLMAAAMGCTSVEDDNDQGGAASSTSAGIPLDPTRSFDPNPLEWVSADQDEFYSTIASVHDNPQYLPTEDVVTRRLQFWSDALYMHLASNHAVRLRAIDGRSAIPRPRVRVMLKASPNGFTSSASTCYKVNIRFAGAQSDAADANSSDVVQVGSRGDVGVYARDKIVCSLDRTHLSVAAKDVVRFLNESAFVQGCTVTEERGDVVFGADCKVGGPSRKGAGTILLDSTTNWVTITSGLVELFDDERHMVGALTHELAHYYLSHGSLSKKHYNYFYRQTPENLAAARPAYDPALSDLGKQLLALPKYRTQPIAHQKFHSELFSYLKLATSRLVEPACGAPTSPCHSSCGRLIQLATDAEIATLFGTFPQAILSGKSLDLYWDYERQLEHCLGNIRLQDSTTVTEQAAASTADVGQVYWMARDAIASGKVSTVLDAVQAMNAIMMDRDDKKNALLQQAIDEKLGYYTTEQEADNLSVQWLATLGINPTAAIEEWFRFAAFGDGSEQVSPFNFGYAQCRALYEATPRWSVNGVPLLVPIGSFADTHHSKCYRIYNLDKEIAATRFVIGADRMIPAASTGGSWASVRNSVVRLHDSMFPVRKTLEAASSARAEWLHLEVSSPNLLLHSAPYAFDRDRHE